MKPATGHDIVADTLVRHGITHVFGVPGQPGSTTLATCIDVVTNGNVPVSPVI